MVDKLTSKYSLANNALNAWKITILAKVRNRIDTLKNKKTPQQSKPTLIDPEVVETLNQSTLNMFSFLLIK